MLAKATRQQAHIKYAIWNRASLYPWAALHTPKSETCKKWRVILLFKSLPHPVSSITLRMKRANEISWVTFSSEYLPVGLWKKVQQSLRRSFTLSEFNQFEHAALKRAKSERSSSSTRMWSNPVKCSFLSLHKKHKEYKIENILSGRCGKLMTNKEIKRKASRYFTSLWIWTPCGGKCLFVFIRG